MIMTNSTYDLLKKIALIIAPLITFVAALCEIWGVPYGTEICATLAALDTLLGALLSISTMNYNKAKAEAEGEEDE